MNPNDFRSLDAEFINPKEDEVTFQCNGTQVNVVKEWQLPVPIATGPSYLSFEFMTEPGDIDFCIAFVTEDGNEDILEDWHRVDSDTTPHYGYFKIVSPGTVVMMWDNSYSWFTEKSLTLTVEVIPAKTREKSRITHSKIILSQIRDEKAKFSSRLTGVAKVIEDVTPEIAQLEKTIRDLKHELREKKLLLAAVTDEKKAIEVSYESYSSNELPLLIRTLNTYELYNVLSFLRTKPMKVVCKYWENTITTKGRDPDGRDEDTFGYSNHNNGGEAYHYDMHHNHMIPTHSNLKISNQNSNNNMLTKCVSEDSIIHVPSAEDAINHNKMILKHTNNSNSNHDRNGSTVNIQNDNIEFEDDEDESLSQGDNHITLRSNGKSRNDILNYLKSSLNAMSKKEDIKVELKKRIDIWKNDFQKVHRREPSDEEKMQGIAPLFKEYSRVRKSLISEEKRLLNILQVVGNGK